MDERLIEDATEFYNERAAVAEYDGGQRRIDAERHAYFETKRRYGYVPAAIVEAIKKARGVR